MENFEQNYRFASVDILRNYVSIDIMSRGSALFSPFKMEIEGDTLLFSHILRNGVITNEKTIEKLKNNPYAAYTIHDYTRKIETFGDIVIYESISNMETIDYSFHESFINDSEEYTRMGKIHYTFMYNKKTGDFSLTEKFSNEKKVLDDTIYENCFTKLYSAFYSIMYNSYMINRPYWDQFNLDFITSLNNHMGFEMVSPSCNYDESLFSERIKEYDLYNNFVKEYIKLKGIKVPNEFKSLIWFKNPKDEFLKKNDNKLVASILDSFGIKSKLTIKIFHQYPNMDVEIFYGICRIFGEKFSTYLSELSERALSKIATINSPYSYLSLIREMFWNQPGYNISEKDKHNIVQIFNSMTEQIDIGLLIMIDDHMKLIKVLREYVPNLQFCATSVSELNREHELYSKLSRKISNGYTVEYQFREETIKVIEEPIKIIKDGKPEFVYPFLLKREEEYIEEGEKMRHCVASYKDKSSSIIVSIRSLDKEERVTNEYHIQNGGRVQSRYFCNQSPPEYLEPAISDLSDKIYELAKWNKLGWIDKKRVPIKINGVEVDIVKIRLENPQYEEVRDIRDIAMYLV